MMRVLLISFLFFQANVSHAEGFHSRCRRFIDRLFFRDQLQVADFSLETALGAYYSEKLKGMTEFHLRYLLPNRVAWNLVAPYIQKARVLDLSKNPRVSQSVLYDLLKANAPTIEVLDLRGVPVSSKIFFDLIASEMPNLQRLRLDSLPWFSLIRLSRHPSLVELDIRKAAPFWYEIRDFIEHHPPKLRFLKVQNYPDAFFIDRLRAFAVSKKSTLRLQAHFHRSFRVDNFKYKPDFSNVLDGDTFAASLRELGGALGSDISIRIKDMDAAEIKSKDPFEAKMAVAARVYLFQLLKGNRVIVDNVEPDKYSGRFAADVFVNGHSVYHEMIRKGLAVYYPFDLDSTKPVTDWKAIYSKNKAFYDELIAQEAILEDQ